MNAISRYKVASPEEKKRMVRLSIAFAGLAICLFVSALGWMIMKFSSVFSKVLANDPNPELFYWLIAGYIICEVATIPLSGKLVDQFGERRVLAVGVIVFVVGTLWCIIADTASWMVVGRCIEGAGAGALFAVAFTSVGTLLKNHERGIGHEIMTGAFAIGSLFGTAIGWWFISYVTNLNLDAPFYFLLVMCIIGGIMAFACLPYRDIDWEGSDIEGAIIVSSLFLTIVAYTQHVGRTFELISPTSFIWLLLIAALILLLYHVEIHVKSPTFPMDMTRAKAKIYLIMIVLCVFALGILQYVFKYVLITPGLYPIDIYGASTLFLFLLAGGACTSVPGCKMVTNTGLRPWVIGGSVLVGLAFICFFTFGYETVNGLRFCMFVLGAGLGCMVTELLCMMQAITPHKDMGKYSSGLMGARMAAIVVGAAGFNYVITTAVERATDISAEVQGMNIFELLFYIFVNAEKLLDKAISSFKDSLLICVIVTAVIALVIIGLGLYLKKEDLEEQEENDKLSE